MSDKIRIKVDFELTPDQHARFRGAAEHERVTLGEACRLLVVNYLNTFLAEMGRLPHEMKRPPGGSFRSENPTAAGPGS